MIAMIVKIHVSEPRVHLNSPSVAVTHLLIGLKCASVSHSSFSHEIIKFIPFHSLLLPTSSYISFQLSIGQRDFLSRFEGGLSGFQLFRESTHTVFAGLLFACFVGAAVVF